mgnify:CR=1 FL=1
MIGMNSGILEDITAKIIGAPLADIQKGTTTQGANKAIKLLVVFRNNFFYILILL